MEKELRIILNTFFREFQYSFGSASPEKDREVAYRNAISALKSSESGENTHEKLIGILSAYCGEKGDSEGAVDTLLRLENELLQIKTALFSVLRNNSKHRRKSSESVPKEPEGLREILEYYFARQLSEDFPKLGMKYANEVSIDKAISQIKSLLMKKIEEAMPKEREVEVDHIVSQIRGHGDDGNYEMGYNKCISDTTSKMKTMVEGL